MSKRTALRATIGGVFVGLLLYLIACVIREANVSRHESQIVSQVVEHGGYVLRPIQSVPDLLNEDYLGKPVLLELAQDNLSRRSGGYLETRITKATFYSEADARFAELLSKSTSLSDVVLEGELGQQLPPPIAMVRTLAGAPLNVIQFRRYTFVPEQIRELAEVLKVSDIVFSECTIPSEALTNLRGITSLKTVMIFASSLVGSDEDIKQSLQALRSAGIDVNIPKLP